MLIGKIHHLSHVGYPHLTWNDMVLFRNTRERNMGKRAWQGMRPPQRAAQGNHVRIPDMDEEELKASEGDGS